MQIGQSIRHSTDTQSIQSRLTLNSEDRKSFKLKSEIE